MARLKKRPGHTPEGAALTALIFAVFRMNGKLLRRGDSLGREFGLTATRWQVLGAIRDTPRTVAQIARFFELSRQGVQWVVNALEREGLVELIDNPEHKRAKLVRFTEAGADAFGSMSRRQETWINEVSEDLTVDEIGAGTRLLEKLSRRL